MVAEGSVTVLGICRRFGGDTLGDIIHRGRALPPGQGAARFRPGVITPGAPWLLPALRAYSGIQVAEARSSRPNRTLGRIGSLEVRIADRAGDCLLYTSPSPRDCS